MRRGAKSSQTTPPRSIGWHNRIAQRRRESRRSQHAYTTLGLTTGTFQSMTEQAAEPKRVLVTGSTGAIGQPVCEHLPQARPLCAWFRAPAYARRRRLHPGRPGRPRRRAQRGGGHGHGHPSWRLSQPGGLHRRSARAKRHRPLQHLRGGCRVWRAATYRSPVRSDHQWTARTRGRAQDRRRLRTDQSLRADESMGRGDGRHVRTRAQPIRRQRAHRLACRATRKKPMSSRRADGAWIPTSAMPTPSASTNASSSPNAWAGRVRHRLRLSKYKNVNRLDVELPRRVLGYEPQDTWPDGLNFEYSLD